MSLSKHRQTGAALVFGMLLLLVLTLLAISGMNTASLELSTAGNAQYRQNAFQSAESGIEHALLQGAFNPAAEAPEVIDERDTDNRFRAMIIRQLQGQALPAAWGSSWNSFSSFHFEIRSEGESDRGARVTTVQGVAVIAPFDASTISPIGGLPASLTP
ncbi:MAG TPA: pilus assembly PilX N-terminal domain-containing protein [Steroidobacter sp.]|nr:pilus assembly PilX N-terminal domain-containing protein [Steroidobacter sp.]